MSINKSEWHDSGNIAQIFESFLEGKPEYPVECPDCGNKSGHIYINRYKDTHRGGAWAWCSSCHSFGHYSYIVPGWWGNRANVDQSKLCAANPNELVQYETSIDEYVNYQLMRYSMSDNVCQYCIRKEYETPKISKCPECGKETWMAQLDGPCMLISCSDCGFEVVGASFFPPCSGDDSDYTITVKEVEINKKVKLAKLFGMNVMELINELRENGQIQKKFKLYETNEILKSLNELKIEAEVSPSLMEKYPELIGCKHRD